MTGYIIRADGQFLVGGLLQLTPCVMTKRQDRVVRCNQCGFVMSLCAGQVMQSDAPSSWPTSPNSNRNGKPSWNTNIFWMQLDGMDYTNLNVSNLVYKSVSYKYDSNLFPFCCAILFYFFCMAWIESNSVPTGTPYPLFNVNDRVSYNN